VLAVTPNVLLRLRLEYLPAGGGTEVEGLASVFKFIGGGTPADFHTADGVFEAGLIKLKLRFHFGLPIRKKKK
jgi:hypothetical protein